MWLSPQPVAGRVATLFPNDSHDATACCAGRVLMHCIDVVSRWSVISLDEVGAHPQPPVAGQWSVTFGLYLPGLTYDKGYRLKVRVIHEADQFIRGIDPKEFWMTWIKGSPLDLWTATVPLAADPAPSHFGQPGRYVYRYQLLRSDGARSHSGFPIPSRGSPRLGRCRRSRSINRRSPSPGRTPHSSRRRSTRWSSTKSTSVSSTRTSTG